MSWFYDTNLMKEVNVVEIITADQARAFRDDSATFLLEAVKDRYLDGIKSQSVAGKSSYEAIVAEDLYSGLVSFLEGLGFLTSTWTKELETQAPVGYEYNVKVIRYVRASW